MGSYACSHTGLTENGQTRVKAAAQEGSGPQHLLFASPSCQVEDRA